MTREALYRQEQEEARQIGRRLRHIREEAGLTLRELAQRLDFPHHTILLKYERGDTVPSAARLVSLARALNCSPAALLARDDRAMPIMTVVDQADDEHLAQLAFVFETLAVPYDDGSTPTEH
jgi:transcriptional regulator with XRE-family HTH domain